MTSYVVADPNRVLVTDISKWQNDPTTPQIVDFSKMKSLGVSGVILKAGQGLYADRDFFINFEELWKVELPKGQYWYYDNRVDPKRQAEAWANIVKQAGDIGELGLWLDLEDRQEGVHKGWKNWYVMLEHLKALVPNAKIGIYTGYYYWMEHTVQLGIPYSSLDYFSQFPLWIAAYKTNSPLIPKPWNAYTFWQFTDLLDGKSYGVESFELDGNYFNGTANEYQLFFNLGDYIPPVVVPPTEEQVMEYECKVVWPLGCSTKSAPNTGGTNFYTWQNGMTFYASELIRDNTDPNNADKLWAKLSRGVHAGKFVAVRYPSSSGNPVRAEYQLLGEVGGGEVVLTHTIQVYSDGSIKIDGISI